jgi:SAM-dependent methyltransferase
MTEPIHFDDGAAYEQFMGVWSQRAGAEFLNWIAPAPGLHWLDVGCGNGAFTELLVERCAPASVHGIDPSEAQIAYAQTRASVASARFQLGDAMALPFPDSTFDAAVMPLVIFFVPEPARGVAEMVRVVRPGGLVCAYAWDMEGGGFPYALVQAELRAMGGALPSPPSPEASQLDALERLSSGAGLTAIQTTVITVHRAYSDFAQYWATVLKGPSVRRAIEALSPAAVTQLRTRLQGQLPADGTGRITCAARANAVVGRVP